MLVRMKLFQKVSAPDDLNDIRFRCVVDSDTVESIARHLAFPLDHYLEG